MQRSRIDSARGGGARAFTLIELLVALAIVVVLFGIIVPTLVAANRQAKLIQCESNLRQWGQVAYNFANDNQGRFPQAYCNRMWSLTVTDTVLSHWSIPNNLTGDDLPNPGETGATPVGSWLDWGTSWRQLESYGLTWNVANCPATDASSSTTETTPYSASAGWLGVENDGGNPLWGTLIYHTNYVYVGGLAATMNHPPSWFVAPTNWGTRIPAGKTCDDDLSDKVLAADAVIDYTAWGQGYMINHPVSGVPNVAKAMNVLYGDGHVSCDIGPLPAVGSSSFSLTWINGSGPYFYWGS